VHTTESQRSAYRESVRQTAAIQQTLVQLSHSEPAYRKSLRVHSGHRTDAVRTTQSPQRSAYRESLRHSSHSTTDTKEHATVIAAEHQRTERALEYTAVQNTTETLDQTGLEHATAIAAAAATRHSSTQYNRDTRRCFAVQQRH
jgi:hypothetical protein